MSTVPQVANVPGRRVAVVGAILGLVVAGLMTVGLVRAEADDPNTGAAWGLALGLAMLAPFLMAMLGVRRPGSRRAPAAWLGAGIAGVLLVMTSPAGGGLVFLPAAVLLLAGGAAASRGRDGRGGTVVAGCVVAGIVTVISMYTPSRAVALTALVLVLVLWLSLFAVVLRPDRRSGPAR